MPRALLEALASWRQRPSEALAHDIDRLSDALTASRPAIAPDAWDERCAACRPEELGSLLAALPSTREARLLVRLDALWRWPRDPRITEALRRLTLYELPGVKSLSLWRRVFALVAHVGDSRAKAWLGDALAELQGPPAAMRRLIQWAEACAGALCSVPEHALKPRPGDAATSHREPPAEPSARSVFADELLEAGDARGELIHLQSLERPQRVHRRRVHALLRAYARPWLGRLSPALKADGLRFERGYVVAGRLSGYRALRELVGAPEWSRFVALDLRELRRHATNPGLLLAFLGHPVLRGLERIDAFPVSCLNALLSSPAALPVKTLDLAGWVSPAELQLLKSCAALPALRTLTVHGQPR